LRQGEKRARRAGARLTTADVSGRLPPLALALAFVVVLALAGCGGGSDGNTTASGSGSRSQGSTATTTSQAGGKQGGASKPASSAAKPLDTSNLPSPQEGSKKAAPGVPVSKGGDNSIQTWGTEASASEREQATSVVRAFLNARADSNWARACSYLAAKPLKEFEGLIKGSKKKGNAACAETMKALSRGVPPSAFDDEARIDYVLSLRVDKDTAFLIYTRSGTNKIYATALGYEDGAWKVISVGPTVLGS
jgi:hypothetical protein